MGGICNTMPYQFDWIVEQKLLRVSVWGEVNLPDTLGIRDEFIKHLFEMPEGAKVHFIMDNRHIQSITVRVTELNQLVKDAKRRDDAVGYVILIIDPSSRMASFLRMISTMAVYLTGARFRLVNNYDEANALLHELDDSLSAIVIVPPLVPAPTKPPLPN